MTTLATSRGVLWDVDGTMLDSADYHWLAWRDALRAEAFELTHERFLDTFGQRNETILRELLGAELPDEEVARIATGKEERYRALVLRHGIELLPGVREWLDRLKDEGWRQAVASSAPPLNLQTLLRAVRVERYLDAIVSAEEVARGKPAPDVFLRAAEKLRVDPSRCVVVEDAPSGLQAARAAGMRCVGVLTSHGALDADVVVRSLEELPLDAFERLLVY